uniref:Uncharacterized protein n=1 Tax=Tanacetum cinerariifolium TaxID=118510 RepID=A0A699QXP6_TANCI|nr:hypothetical protein [Tanacetum cinerariifolium]
MRTRPAERLRSRVGLNRNVMGIKLDCVAPGSRLALRLVAWRWPVPAPHQAGAWGYFTRILIVNNGSSVGAPARSTMCWLSIERMRYTRLAGASVTAMKVPALPSTNCAMPVPEAGPKVKVVLSERGAWQAYTPAT